MPRRHRSTRSRAHAIVRAVLLGKHALRPATHAHVMQTFHQRFSGAAVFLETSSAARILNSVIAAMKRWLGILMIIGALLANGCYLGEGDGCEYSYEEVNARVSITPVTAPQDCWSDPVEVTVTWKGGSSVLYMGMSPVGEWPRACLEANGLTEGAIVRINVGTVTDGPCERRVELVGGNERLCFDLCNADPQCPVAEPTEGAHCLPGLSCRYGEPIHCQPVPGVSKYFDCVDDRWVASVKSNCAACGMSCDQPTCAYCSELLALSGESTGGPLYCTETSKLLFEGMLSCACDILGPCGWACLSAPSGEKSFCDGGKPSEGCNTCLHWQGGCSVAMEACAQDPGP